MESRGWMTEVGRLSPDRLLAHSPISSAMYFRTSPRRTQDPRNSASEDGAPCSYRCWRAPPGLPAGITTVRS
jgi:hypothetical protein